MKDKKDVYYFSHDANAHQDPKTKAMMSVYGAEGYGWYWILIEIMRQQEGYCISTAKKYDIPSLSSSLPNCNAEKCKEFIDDCINEFDLFESDKKQFWSPSLIKRMEKVDEIVEKRRSAANKRWGKKKETPASVFPAEEKQQAVKPEPIASKIKTIKVLQDDQLFGLFVEQLKEHDDFKDYTDKYLQSERSKCLDWIAAKGAIKKDYKAFFRNWLRNNSEGVQQKEPSKQKRGVVI